MSVTARLWLGWASRPKSKVTAEGAAAPTSTGDGPGGGGREWMVYVSHKRIDGTKLSDRKVIQARTHAAAIRWGQGHLAWMIERDLVSSKEGVVTERSKRARVPTLKEYSKTWLEFQAANPKRKAAALACMQSQLENHLLPFMKDKHLDEIDDAVVDSLRVVWAKGGYQSVTGREIRPTMSQSTVNNRLTVLRSLLTHAVSRKVGGMREMPCKIAVPTRGAPAEAEHYDHETLDRLLTAAKELDQRIYTAILLGCDAGLRRGEAIALYKTDVDLVRGRLLVQRSVFWRHERAHEGPPKGRVAKFVPLTPRLAAALRVAMLASPGPTVLVRDEGGMCTPKTMVRWMRRAERRAGLPQTSGRMHILRHTFASHLAMAGAPSLAIMALGRWGSLGVMARYAHLSPGVTDSAIEMLTASRAAGGAPVPAVPPGTATSTHPAPAAPGRRKA